MFIRNRSTIIFFVLLLSLPAAGGELPPAADSTLAAAAEQMKLKNYSSAARIATASKECGRRDFMAGMAELKGKRYDEASKWLAKAAKSTRSWVITPSITRLKPTAGPVGS